MNYLTTNYLISAFGKKGLHDIRKLVYKDVIDLANRCGTIFKSEIDGVYLTNHNNNFEIPFFGKVKVKHYPWIISFDKMLILKDKSGCSIKGLEKLAPNIFFKTIQDIMNSKNIEQRELIISDFLQGRSNDIVDFGYRDINGYTLTFRFEDSDYVFDCCNNDLFGINKLQSDLNKDHYIQGIKPVLEFIFEVLR